MPNDENKQIVLPDITKTSAQKLVKLTTPSKPGPASWWAWLFNTKSQQQYDKALVTYNECYSKNATSLENFSKAIKQETKTQLFNAQTRLEHAKTNNTIAKAYKNAIKNEGKRQDGTNIGITIGMLAGLLFSMVGLWYLFDDKHSDPLTQNIKAVSCIVVGLLAICWMCPRENAKNVMASPPLNNPKIKINMENSEEFQPLLSLTN